jgi:hypothetical protein
MSIAIQLINKTMRRIFSAMAMSVRKFINYIFPNLTFLSLLAAALNDI